MITDIFDEKEGGLALILLQSGFSGKND